jgi:hypothetical protein
MVIDSGAQGGTSIAASAGMHGVRGGIDAIKAQLVGCDTSALTLSADASTGTR